MQPQLDSPRPDGSGRSPGRWLLPAALLVLVAALTHRLVQVQQRLDELESAQLDEALDLQQSLFGFQSDLFGIRGELEASVASKDDTEELSERLQMAESKLGYIHDAVQTTSTSIDKIQQEYGPDALTAKLEERDASLETRWESLDQMVSTAQAAASASLLDVRRLEATIDEKRDLSRMWRDLVGPVVQLAGETSVGSGVLLRSEELGEEPGFRTHLLTAWHVVRDIQGDLSKTDMPVPVFIYTEDGDVEEEEAKLLAFNVELDAALLVIETDSALPNGAGLAPRSRLAEVRVFERVYAVGCPLGNDPIPTNGEVATTDHTVDGESYWMINAPTYIGNSGGGIFDSKSRELLGIFSKIYTHGSLRPTIVPHMGLVTPLTAIYDWLEEAGHASVVPTDPSETRETDVASASF